MYSGLLLSLLGGLFGDQLPTLQLIRSQLLNEPVQEKTSRAAFGVSAGGVDYKVKPLFDYELYGLVVSKHDSASWLDYAHRDSNDKLNVADLCVVWGNNISNGIYQKLKYSSGQWTCFVSSKTMEDWEMFSMSHLSNNHLLTNDPLIAKKIRSVRVGDQINLRGVLSEYEHHHGGHFKRGTSITRDDTGDGACETIFIDSFRVVKAANRIWRNMVWVGLVLFVIGVVRFFLQPVTFNDD
jgi:hypothetical protein